MSTSNPTTKIARSPLLAIFIALVFLMGPLPGPGQLVESAEAQATTGLRITADDYATDVDTLYGEGAYAYVVLTNPSATGLTEQRDVITGVTVKSTLDTTGITIDLLETGPETGVFYGGFGFNKTARQEPGVHPFLGRLGINNATDPPEPATGKVRVASGNTVTVTAPGGSDTIVWRQAASAVPVTDPATPVPGGAVPSIFGTARSISFEITDADLDVSASRDVHEGLLFVSSDSDPEGVRPTLAETAPSSGVFTASVELRTTSASDNLLFVRPNEHIRATFHDANNKDGLPVDMPLGPWKFVPATDGTIRFHHDDAFIGNTTAGTENGLDRAVITVFDGDPHDGATPDRVFVDVFAETPGGEKRDCVKLTLTQLPGTAVGQADTAFIGTLAFNAPGSIVSTTHAACTSNTSGSPEVLTIQDGQTVRVVYQDERDENGDSTTRQNTRVWRSADTAKVVLGASSETHLLRGTASVSVAVTDPDSNRKTDAIEVVQVRARSDSNPAGIQLSLSEDNANSPRFTGTLQLTTGDEAGRLKVADGDLVTVEYIDPVSKTGKQEIVGANGGNGIFWRPLGTPTIFTQETKYYRANATNGPILTSVDVFVQDQSRNNPIRRDQVDATAFSQPTSGTPDQVPLQLQEVGVDSGLFHGVLRFEALDSLGIAERLRVGTAGQMDFVLEYDGASSGTRTFVHVPATEAESVLRVENATQDGARAVSRVFVPTDGAKTVFTIMLHSSSGAPASLTAKLESPSCHTTAARDDSRSVTLTRAGPSNRYSATFVLTDIASLTDQSCANAPATVLPVVIGQDFWINATVGSTPLSARVRTASITDETATFLDRPAGTAITDISGVNNRGVFEVSGGEHNFNSATREVIRVNANTWRTGEQNPTMNKLIAVETAPDSGVFRGSFTFENAATAGDLDAKQAIHVAGHDSVVRTAGEERAGYGMYTSVVVLGRDGEPLRTLTWWASGAAAIGIDRQAFGNRGFQVLLTDQDAFPMRASQTVTGSNTQQSYSFSDPGFVRKSEFVYYVDLQKTWDGLTTGSTGLKIPLETRAAEQVTDRNKNGVAGCDDVTLTGTMTPFPPTSPTTLGPGDITCTSTTGGNITFDFKRADGTITCTHDTGALGQKCTATAVLDARARDVPSCSQQFRMQYEYTQTGIRFCAAPQETDIRFEFLQGARTIKVQSRGATAGSILETEEITLRYNSTASAARGTPTFSGTVPVEVSAGANNGNIFIGEGATRSIVQFTYRDRATVFDGKPGSDQFEHHRAVRAVDQWRSAQDAEIKVMASDFVAQTSSPVRGPAVFVEVADRDSDRTENQDTITLTALSQVVGGDSETLVLRESSTRSGIFRGVLQVSSQGVQHGDGELQFNANSGTIRFSYQDQYKASGEPGTIPLSVEWRAAGPGTVTLYDNGDFSGSSLLESGDVVRGTLGRIFIDVFDPDANQNDAVVEQFTVRVQSIYDPIGELITVTETTADIGRFRSAGVPFQATLVENDGKVFSRDCAFNDLVQHAQCTADEIWVTYDDQLDANGNRKLIPSVNVGWDRQFDGIVDLDLAFYIGTNVAAESHLAEAHVTVTDGDFNRDPRAVDVLTLGTNPSTTYEFGFLRPSGIDPDRAPALKALIETGANTGVFIGVASFKDSASNPDDEDWTAGSLTRATVPMTNTASLRFIYHDGKPASGGEPIETFDTAQWYRAGYGVLGFDRSGYNDLTKRVVLRLYDSHLPTGPELTVTSEAQTDGVSVPMTTKRAGVFEGTLTLTDVSGGQGLFVNDLDELFVQYTDANPAGVREARATIRIDDFEPPVSSLATTPTLPDGENGWFVTQPQISFAANEPLQDTFYRLDGGGTRLFSTPFTVTEGVHEIEFWSVDSVGNEEAPKTVDVKFDATAPTTSVTDLKARSAPLGAIELNWAPVTGKTDPLQFGSYKVYQGTTSNYVGNSTTESFSHIPASDGTHTYLVAVADAAGNVDVSKAISVAGISDRVAPRMVSASVSPTELFEELDLDLTVTITGTVNEADLSDVDRVEANVLNPFDEGITNVTMTRQGTTNVWRGTFADFPGISGNYTFKIAALDKAGNAAPENRSVRFHAIDREPPRVTVPETVVQGTPLTVAVKDNDKGIATISYRLNGAGSVNVPVTGGPLDFTFTVPTGALPLGTHSLSVSVADLNGTANFATYDLTFTVTDSDGTAPPPTGGAPVVQLVNKFVENGGRMKLRVGSPTPLTALTVAFDGGAAQAVLSSWQSGGVTEVSVGSLAAGKHTARVVATNGLDTVTQTLEIYVLDPGIPLPPTGVQVTRGPDGFPLITWTASESTNVGGYLVHRASSPYKVIKVVDAETLEHPDRTAEPGTTYRYAVTAFGTDGTGRLDEGAESETEMPWLLEIEGSSFTVEDDASNFWTVFWVILILLVVVSAVVLLVVYRERIFRPRGESGEIYDDDYPDASGTATLPFGEQQHDLRCPNCTTEFSVTGEKPIVTTCPNCGKKGILR